MTLRNVILACAMAVTASPCAPVDAQEPCLYWQSRVDREVARPREFETFDEQAHIIAGIECLLQMEGREGAAAFGGATGYNVSQIDPIPPVEVAALFYISYMYERDWRSVAETVTLVDGAGRTNTPEAIAAAYRGYRAWFAKVKQVGIERARESKLDPLKGTGVHWR